MTESDCFEERLLDQLRPVVAQNHAPAHPASGPRRRGRLVLGGAGCAATLAAVAFVAASGGTTTSAYAVEARPDGLVDVSIHSLDDAGGLQGSLEAAGIPAIVDFDPADRAACAGTSGRTMPDVPAHEEDGVTWAQMPPAEDGQADSLHRLFLDGFTGVVIRGAEGVTFIVNPDSIASGEQVVVTSADGTVNRVEMSVSPEGTAGACGA